MSRLIDLTGQRFGMLTVLCRSVAYITGKDISFQSGEQALKYLLSYKEQQNAGERPK